MIIRCETYLINLDKEKIGIEEGEFRCPFFFDSDSIETLRPALDEDNEFTKESIVGFKSGDEHKINVDFKKLVKLIWLDTGVKINILDENS